MTINNLHITLQQIIDALDDKEQREILFTRLKQEDPTNDEVRGVKLFLEANDYDAEKLKSFLIASENQFDELLFESKSKSNFIWLRVAAVIIPLIAIGSYLIFTQNKNEAKLYAKYYEKEVGLPVLMSSNDDKVFRESMNAFRDNEYEEALSGFSELLETKANNDTLLYFSACSNMELDNNSEAIKQFKAVPEHSVFKEKSDYRLALTHIKKGDFEKAKQKLLVIANSAKHQYNSKAKKLLKEDIFN